MDERVRIDVHDVVAFVKSKYMPDEDAKELVRHARRLCDCDGFLTPELLKDAIGSQLAEHYLDYLAAGEFSLC